MNLLYLIIFLSLLCTSADLQHNKIEDVEVLSIFEHIPDLRVLYMQGNPVVKKIPHYRKTVISKCKQLRYLDDRPVFEDERRRVDAWASGYLTGGTFESAQEAERLEILKIRKEKDEVDERNFRFFEQMMQDGIRERCRREGIQTTSIDSGEVSINPFSGLDFLSEYN